MADLAAEHQRSNERYEADLARARDREQSLTPHTSPRSTKRTECSADLDQPRRKSRRVLEPDQAQLTQRATRFAHVVKAFLSTDEERIVFEARERPEGEEAELFDEVVDAVGGLEKVDEASRRRVCCSLPPQVWCCDS